VDEIDAAYNYLLFEERNFDEAKKVQKFITTFLSSCGKNN